MAATWRVLDTGPAAGPWNLALDEAILEAVARGASPPTLRLYAWSPPALSIGYAQDRDRDVDLAACRARGIEVVRRPTGGRAVLHDREVTYSVAAPPGHPLARAGLAASCADVAGALVAGLRALGVPAEAEPRGGAGAGGRGPGCFASAARHEVTVGGRKVVGSAQRRSGGAVLQHGSILLAGHGDRIAALLRGGPPGACAGAGLGDWLRPCPGYAEVAAAVAAGFRSAWGIELEPGEPSAGELAAAGALEAGRYRTEPWNARRAGPGQPR